MPPGAMPPGMSGAPKPGAEGKPGEAKPGEAKPPESVKRPTTPPKPADRAELKRKPDPDGKFSFNFKNQRWEDVLEWLADISAMSLDWQELPGDYLNLVTQKKYTVKEGRDLINRHLLARGYTLLTQGETLSVVNVKNVNPAMVPRVTLEELEKRDPYEFVKVSFRLEWMIAKVAAEEIKPLLSSNGKITPMENTNRLEVMDAVVNLREVREVLRAEQSPESKEMLVKKFPLIS
jgi:type II secretory pathway component GspD/PulD (secretin)